MIVVTGRNGRHISNFDIISFILTSRSGNSLLSVEDDMLWQKNLGKSLQPSCATPRD